MTAPSRSRIPRIRTAPADGGWVNECPAPCGWVSWHPRRPGADRAAREHLTGHAPHRREDDDA